jgi:HlyD family secretion protein
MRALPLVAAVGVLAAGAAGYLAWTKYQANLVPPGLARANGRIEVERADVATKYAGRIFELSIREGDAVTKGDVVARMDLSETLAQVAAAKAAVRRAEEGVGKAEAEVNIKVADLKLAEVEVGRARELEKRSVASVAELDRRTAQRDVAAASLEAAKAAVNDSKAAVESAQAQLQQVEAVLADLTLKAPVTGRVEYKLAQPGEVVAAGGRLATLLDLTDVYMTIFLPTKDAGKVALGSQARIVLDAASTYVIPGTVSFVAAEAQFTPKYVETADEREKLMYRVKLSIDPALLATYRPYVKAGLTGIGYVLLGADAKWPQDLQTRLPDAP